MTVGKAGPAVGDVQPLGGALLVAAAVIILALAAMAALHERHYKSRAQRIIEARASGHIEDRLATLESILAEDRLT